MRKWKQWTVGLCSGFSQTLSEFENHEAVTAAALGDMRTSLARAGAHAARLRTAYEALLSEIKAAETQAKKWKERARLETEEEPALECLRRSNTCSQKATSLATRAREGKARLEEVEARIKHEEARYVELRDKHRLYQARQAAAQASAACNDSQSGVPQVDEAFERWEMKIAEKQYYPHDRGACSTNDSFAERYALEEERASLGAEWRALKTSSNQVASQAVPSEAESPQVDLSDEDGAGERS